MISANSSSTLASSKFCSFSSSSINILFSSALTHYFLSMKYVLPLKVNTDLEFLKILISSSLTATLEFFHSIIFSLARHLFLMNSLNFYSNNMLNDLKIILDLVLHNTFSRECNNNINFFLYHSKIFLILSPSLLCTLIILTSEHLTRNFSSTMT